MSKYIAQIETSIQIAEDFWSVVRPCMEIDSNTKISEIESWVKKQSKKHKQEITEFRVINIEGGDDE